MSFFGGNAGVRRLAIALAVAGVITGSVWEYEHSAIMPNWREYGWMRTQQAERPGSRMVAQKDGSVILIRTVPAFHKAATARLVGRMDLGSGWHAIPADGWDAVDIDIPAHDEQVKEAGVYRASDAGDYVGALMAILLAGLSPFLLVHTTAWVIQGFRKAVK